MTRSKFTYRIARRAGNQGARPPVGRQAGVEKYATGCGSSSLLTTTPGTTRNTQECVAQNPPQPKKTDVNDLISKNVKTFNNIKIATLNMQTLQCDIKLSTTIHSASELDLDIFALQEVRRKGQGEIEFENESIKGWRMVWYGYVVIIGT